MKELAQGDVKLMLSVEGPCKARSTRTCVCML